MSSREGAAKATPVNQLGREIRQRRSRPKRGAGQKCCQNRYSCRNGRPTSGPVRIKIPLCLARRRTANCAKRTWPRCQARRRCLGADRSAPTAPSTTLKLRRSDFRRKPPFSAPVPTVRRCRGSPVYSIRPDPHARFVEFRVCDGSLWKITERARRKINARRSVHIAEMPHRWTPLVVQFAP